MSKSAIEHCYSENLTSEVLKAMVTSVRIFDLLILSFILMVYASYFITITCPAMISNET